MTTLITILKSAVQTTVQDLGRRGYRHMGIGSCGAIDPLSLRIGNLLVGNAEDAAGLELCLPPATIRFDASYCIALTGADCSARLAGEPLNNGRCVRAEAETTLELGIARAGARTYLCVAGGIDVPVVLGSRSTDLQAQMGGFNGRMICRGDVLNILPATGSSRTSEVAVLPNAVGRIRVLPGPEFQEFEPQAQATFFGSEWKVTPQSNRMGYRLAGPTLHRRLTDELRSHGVFPGMIQVPPGGAPIILMADAQATGGYPRFASVIAADMWRLGQVVPGASVRFDLCNQESATLAWRDQEENLRAISASLHGN